ncbi:MAG: alkyl hydroperoxide reductase subunit F [Parcubacteria group bacterium GW2011_GWC2_52_8c]|nr:MAG: alkyl hydroperoxide reductase subunit F [Parcubacteria group bacterium GW2011_GWA1_51_12]KKW30154.1 MAG: alkyl hydroperoxide reductase subunit F [Parcubacteria group bacterium GW2011_GWC2_52_8c]
MHDVVIVGGGPAAIGAAVYAARKKLKTVLVAKEFGGQSAVSSSIENWIGEESISGFDLAQKLERHLRAQKSIEIISGELANKVSEISGGFQVETDQGKTLETKTVVLASGSRRRRLGIPGEAKFEGKGVVFCATCDAPLFQDKTVAVVGGGNAGLESVVDLSSYAEKIYLVVRGDTLRGDQITQDEVKGNAKVEIIYGALPEEVLGDQFVTGLRYKDKNTNEVRSLAVDGIFVEIGAVPNSEIMGGLVKLNQFNEVVIDHKTGATSKPGIYAAGDVTDEIYKQNNISVGDAVKAALSAYNYILGMHRRSPAEEISV